MHIPSFKSELICLLLSNWISLKLQPFPKQHILVFLTKGFANNIFKFGECGRKFSKGVENTVGKGEIARYEQFLLFPQCFQKTCTADS